MPRHSDGNRCRLLRDTGACVGIAAILMGAAVAGACERYSLGAGVIHIAPNSSSGPLVVQDAPIPGTGIEASNETTLLLVAECETSPTLKIRLAFGWPPIHKLRGTGSLAAAGELGEVQQFSPGLLAIYTFAERQAWRPFVGAGINYTWFKKARFTNQAYLDGLFGPGPGATVSIDGSWNPLAIAGLTYRFDPVWSLEAAVTYLPIKARADIAIEPTPVGLVRASNSIENRTVALSLTVAYRWGK